MHRLTLTAAFSLFLLGALCAQAADKLVIKGSNTFGESLGPRLIEEFRKAKPNVDVELESKGSASGFAALTAGQCDIGASSRPATPDEWRLARSRGIKLQPYPVGYYGVAVIVNDANLVRGLKDSEVRDIFTGAVTNWKSVGGPDAPINIYIRDPISGTHLGFQELAMEKLPYAPAAKHLKSDEEIAAAVAADRNGIGYVGMHMVSHKGVHGVTINGVPPTPIAINEDLYPYARLILLYTDSRRESSTARQFLKFIRSRSGQKVLEEMGYVRWFERRMVPSTGGFN